MYSTARHHSVSVLFYFISNTYGDQHMRSSYEGAYWLHLSTTNDAFEWWRNIRCVSVLMEIIIIVTINAPFASSAHAPPIHTLCAADVLNMCFWLSAYVATAINSHTKNPPLSRHLISGRFVYFRWPPSHQFPIWLIVGKTVVAQYPLAFVRLLLFYLTIYSKNNENIYSIHGPNMIFCLCSNGMANGPVPPRRSYTRHFAIYFKYLLHSLSSWWLSVVLGGWFGFVYAHHIVLCINKRVGDKNKKIGKKKKRLEVVHCLCQAEHPIHMEMNTK